MIPIVYSRNALADLERLVGFLIEAEADDAEAAARAIVEGIRLLERHPYIGRRLRPPLRELVIAYGRAGYVAMYRVLESRVEILAIRHQREAGTIR